MHDEGRGWDSSFLEEDGRSRLWETGGEGVDAARTA